MKAIDITGNKYGELTVKCRSGNDKYGHALWECVCACGGEMITRGVDLKSGHTVGCGCQQNKLIDETGNRYGLLTVLARSANAPKTHLTMWLCVCDCGNEKSMPGVSLRGGYSTGCGCRHPLPKGEATFNSLISGWKTRAKKRKVKFTLSRKDIIRLIKEPCYYCGIEPYQEHKYKYRGENNSLIYQGLDRKDSKKGYTLKNVVPCCGKCNRIKHVLSQDEFRRHILVIYNYWIAEEKDAQNK